MKIHILGIQSIDQNILFAIAINLPKDILNQLLIRFLNLPLNELMTDLVIDLLNVAKCLFFLFFFDTQMLLIV
jgi:hypothetical protein